MHALLSDSLPTHCAAHARWARSGNGFEVETRSNWDPVTSVRTMNVKHLKFFLQVAEIGSLTQAAAVLCIAQPALSRQIQQLEDELSVTLFRRSERGVTLIVIAIHKIAGPSLTELLSLCLDTPAQVRETAAPWRARCLTDGFGREPMGRRDARELAVSRRGP